MYTTGGKVDIEIETKDGNVRQLTVTPTQAAVLHILEKETKVGRFGNNSYSRI